MVLNCRRLDHLDRLEVKILNYFEKELKTSFAIMDQKITSFTKGYVPYTSLKYMPSSIKLCYIIRIINEFEGRGQESMG